MVGIDGTMVDAQPPAIKQSGHAMPRGMTIRQPEMDLGWWS